MTNLDDTVMAYMSGGGTRPATFLRGYSDAGRFGINGEGAGIPEEAQADYAAGGAQAQKDRQQWVDRPDDWPDDNNESTTLASRMVASPEN